MLAVAALNFAYSAELVQGYSASRPESYKITFFSLTTKAANKTMCKELPTSPHHTFANDTQTAVRQLDAAATLPFLPCTARFCRSQSKSHFPRPVPNVFEKCVLQVLPSTFNVPGSPAFRLGYLSVGVFQLNWLGKRHLH